MPASGRKRICSPDVGSAPRIMRKLPSDSSPKIGRGNVERALVVLGEDAVQDVAESVRRAVDDIRNAHESSAGQHAANARFEGGQLILNDVPNDLDVDPEVFMDEDVS